MLSNIIIEEFEFSDDLLEYESENHRLSSQIKEFSQHIQNNDFVKTFLENVSENIINGDVSSKQVSLVKNIINSTESINSDVNDNQEHVFESEIKKLAMRLLIS